MSAALALPTEEPRPSDRVELHVVRGERMCGLVVFVECGWVYWRDDGGRVHASRPDALRVLASKPPRTARALLDRLRHA